MSSLQAIQVFIASSNPGKLREYRVLAGDSPIELALLPNFHEIPPFEETALTFAENSAGKALYYSRFAAGTVLADDSGLVVPALGGAPGVFSARYAGPGASDADRVQKLLREMSALNGDDRKARFVCVTTLAQDGRAVAVLSDSVEGVIAQAHKGSGGFGYDPVFFFPSVRAYIRRNHARGEESIQSSR